MRAWPEAWQKRKVVGEKKKEEKRGKATPIGSISNGSVGNGEIDSA